MLRYINHRFHCGTISFQIPDGFYFNSEPGEESDNTLNLCDPDETFTLELRVEEDCDGSAVELESVINDLAPTVVYPIAPLTINGLSGHHVTYRNRRTQYYEAWFDMADDASFSLIISTAGDILDIDAAAIVTAIDPRPEAE